MGITAKDKPVKRKKHKATLTTKVLGFVTDKPTHISEVCRLIKDATGKRPKVNSIRSIANKAAREGTLKRVGASLYQKVS